MLTITIKYKDNTNSKIYEFSLLTTFLLAILVILIIIFLIFFIKKAASTLIVNQEPNTDIIRTDGNEFLVYMVGYSEKDVISYTRKIYKELKELPYGYGAAIGYSMIMDDIKTVDDAINEATIDMRNKKENNNG